MEAKLNSYMGRAHSDYLYARAGMAVGEEYGDYNGVASMCAQAAGKYLKAVIEQCIYREDTISLLKSHNLRVLLNAIREEYPDIGLDAKDLKWLGDFYFDARYPGDNFVEVSREDALECLKITEETERKTVALLQAAEKEQTKKKKLLKELKTFVI